jgi:hypothetical protein
MSWYSSANNETQSAGTPFSRVRDNPAEYPELRLGRVTLKKGKAGFTNYLHLSEKLNSLII